jgi:membrane associated rhomboid family serine protease
MEQFFYVFGLVPAYYTAPTGAPAGYLPLVTSTFLHGGWMHLIGNMWILWLFGDNVEDRMGSGRFLLFYIICGILAGLTHLFIYPNSNVPVVGASGAVAGVMGAYFLMFRHARVFTFIPPIFFCQPSRLDLSGVLGLVQLWSGTVGVVSPNGADQIAFWAHVGGFAAGMPSGVLFRKARARILYLIPAACTYGIINELVREPAPTRLYSGVLIKYPAAHWLPIPAQCCSAKSKWYSLSFPDWPLSHPNVFLPRKDSYILNVVGPPVSRK